MSKFQPVPKAMFPMINNLSGGVVPVRVISRTVRQASNHKHRKSTVVGGTFYLTEGISKRFGKAATALGTTKSSIVSGIIHATLPKLEQLASAVEKPVKKLCPTCKREKGE
jgi:hypothetical protein